MIKFFKPEDFSTVPIVHLDYESAADRANKLLDERGLLLYGKRYMISPSEWNEIDDGKNNHKALLVCIEPLVKK